MQETSSSKVMSSAPIVIFTYNRLWHIQQAIDALLKNDECKQSDLYIFSDGPKNESDSKKVQDVRKFLHSITGFSTIQIIERKENIGLANSIISGVTEIVDKYEKIIVLEDDIYVSPYFLRYMNDGLNIFEHNEKVISIHGYMFQINEPLPETFFIKGADCWGWATWKRGWNLFEPDAEYLLRKLKENALLQRFDFFGSYPYSRMLEDQINGKNDSWAVRWYASALINDRLTLYPSKSLVKNIGFDKSGTHCDTDPTGVFAVELKEEPVLIEVEDTKVKENPYALFCFSMFYAKVIQGRKRRILSKLKILLYFFYMFLR